MLDIKNEHTKSETIRKTFFNIPNTQKLSKFTSFYFLAKFSTTPIIKFLPNYSLLGFATSEGHDGFGK